MKNKNQFGVKKGIYHLSNVSTRTNPIEDINTTKRPISTIHLFKNRDNFENKDLLFNPQSTRNNIH